MAKHTSKHCRNLICKVSAGRIASLFLDRAQHAFPFNSPIQFTIIHPPCFVTSFCSFITWNHCRNSICTAETKFAKFLLDDLFRFFFDRPQHAFSFQFTNSACYHSPSLFCNSSFCSFITWNHCRNSICTAETKFAKFLLDLFRFFFDRPQHAFTF